MAMNVENLISTFLGALLGAGLGIPAGLILDRLLSAQSRREQAAAILRVVVEALQSNLQHIEQISQAVKNPQIPDYIPSIDRSWWHAGLIPRLEAIQDASPRLLPILFLVYTSLSRLDKLCTQWIQFHYSPHMKATTGWENYDRLLRQQISGLTEECKKGIKEAENAVNVLAAARRRPARPRTSST